MSPFARSVFLPGVIIVCLLATGVQPAGAAPERVEIEGLISAAPVPAGFTVMRRDVTQRGVTANYLVLAKDGSPTRGLVQIERREFSTRPARIDTLKAYLEAAFGSWRKKGYAVKARTLPAFETIDFAKPVLIDLDLTKEGEKPIAIHMEVFFDRFAYQTASLSTDDGELKVMIDWCKSVRPATAGAATRPAE